MRRLFPLQKQLLLNFSSGGTTRRISRFERLRRLEPQFTNIAWAALALYLGTQIVSNEQEYRAEKERILEALAEDVSLKVKAEIGKSKTGTTLIKNLEQHQDVSAKQLALSEEVVGILQRVFSEVDMKSLAMNHKKEINKEGGHQNKEVSALPASNRSTRQPKLI